LEKNKVLIFKNIMVSTEGKGQEQTFSCGSHYLSSALKRERIPVALSDSRISADGKHFVTHAGRLKKILRENQDINFILVSLSEFYFEKAKRLIKFLRKNSRAFIGIGGIMPALTPRHVFTHLPEINFLVRGIGEETLPEIIKILDGKNICSPLTKEEIRRLSELRGFLFSNKNIFVASDLDYINKAKNYDNSSLDFSFLKKEDLTEGITLFTSWGCFNNCLFCTSPIKGKYLAKSFKNLKEILKNYHERLKRLYGKDIPSVVLKVSFYDDDFLGDPERAIRFFSYVKKSPFKINFFQTGINSFFEKVGGRYSDRLHQRLLKSLSPEIFVPLKEANIYIGLENLSDEELKRLGKGYNYRKAEKVIKALALKKTKAVYHFIASNQSTSLDNIVENLFKFSVFQLIYGQYFNILTPIIPHLVSLYPSASYKVSLMNKREKFINIRRILSVKNHPEYNYPLVQNDIPISKAVQASLPSLYDLFLTEKDYLKILDKTLFNLLLLREKASSAQKEISCVIEKYNDYPRMIHKKISRKIANDRNNLQLMITRRCHLRCKYCPIVKRNEDMNEDVLYQAINLLFTSSRDNLRLDFTGGEPLLRFDLVKKGVGYAKKLARKKNKGISFYLVTNLIAMNDDIADFLARENFFLELSVDGEEKFHNLYKIGKNPKLNAYRSTTTQLQKVFLRKINNYAVMVVNPTTVSCLWRNFYHILKLGFRRIGVNYALCSMWEEDARREFFRQFNLIRRTLHPYIKNGAIRLSNLESRVEPAILNSEIMINVDGKVHLLTDWLFEREVRKKAPPLGEIKDFKNINEIFLTRFRTLSRLFKYQASPEIKEVIFNNIEMGNLAKSYFEEWKRKLMR